MASAGSVCLRPDEATSLPARPSAVMALAAILVVGLVIPFQVVRAQLRGIRAALSPVVESAGHGGSTVRTALRVSLPEQFHVQSDVPRDPTLIPTVLTVDPPPGVSVVEIVYPEASDFEQIGQAEPLAVFEHEFDIGVVLALDTDVAPGRVDVPGHLRYQACDDRVCFAPVTTDFLWTLTVVDSSAPRPAQHGELFDGIAFGTGSEPLIRTLRPSTRPVATDAAGMALLDDFTVAASTGGYMGRDDFLQFVRNAEAGVREQGLLEGRGPLAILVLVLLGGLALNLTPCVLPMIPINLAIIGAGATSGSRSRGFLLGAVYGAAMAVVYGLLGVIVIMTAGTFGTINASPWFNLSIAVIFVALALAMFDVFTIDFSRFSASFGDGGGGRGSLTVAFSMGAIAALLAGACVAPVVIQVVVFSSDLYAKGIVAALALPFLLGVGMAIPWPVAGAGLTALPKPGAWMVRVKQGFGVIILATAAYYGYLAYGLFADRFVDADAVASSVEEKLKEGWYASLGEGLAVAQRDRKPVLVDLWATWCKNCLVMDQTTLADADVTDTLDDYVKIKFQAEQPDESPVREVMERFDAIGLPTYVILHPAGSEVSATN